MHCCCAGLRLTPCHETAIFVDNISLTNGGCSCNTAIALGRLGVETSVIGKVGYDTFGDFLMETMDGAGWDTHAMVRDPSVNTSATAVLIDSEGERSFLHFSEGVCDEVNRALTV